MRMLSKPYVPITIYDMLAIRLESYQASLANGDKSVKTFSLNDRTRLRLERATKNQPWLQSTKENVLIIDITGWTCIGKTIKSKRANKLKDFCNSYKDAAVVIVIYDDTNPAVQVIEAVREILPDLQMKHFSTCNNLAGKNRALWFERKRQAV